MPSIIFHALIGKDTINRILEETNEINRLHIADMAIDTFHAESILLRVMKMEAQKGENDTSLQIDMMRTCLCHAADRIHKSGKDTINAFAEGDEERMMLTGLNRFTKTPAYNSKAARRRIADAFIAAEKYHF